MRAAALSPSKRNAERQCNVGASTNAVQVPSLAKEARQAIEHGFSVVIGLQSTGEAAQKKEAEEVGALRPPHHALHTTGDQQEHGSPSGCVTTATQHLAQLGHLGEFEQERKGKTVGAGDQQEHLFSAPKVQLAKIVGDELSDMPCVDTNIASVMAAQAQVQPCLLALPL